jgi:hypothetical protein
VAITLNLLRDGTIGFIERLGLFVSQAQPITLIAEAAYLRSPDDNTGAASRRPNELKLSHDAEDSLHNTRAVITSE